MKHRYELQLRYSDSDQMGVVYHANYFSFFELGRTAMLREQGIDYYDIERRGYMFPVRDVDCTFLKPITLGERIFCETELVELTKVKIVFEHKLMDGMGEVKAIGHSSIIAVRKDDFRIIKMDEHLPDVFALKDVK